MLRFYSFTPFVPTLPCVALKLAEIAKNQALMGYCQSAWHDGHVSTIHRMG